MTYFAHARWKIKRLLAVGSLSGSVGETNCSQGMLGEDSRRHKGLLPSRIDVLILRTRLSFSSNQHFFHLSRKYHLQDLTLLTKRMPWLVRERWQLEPASCHRALKMQVKFAAGICFCRRSTLIYNDHVI